MSFELTVFFSLTISIAAIAGLVRIKHIDGKFLPFLYLVFAALINEVASIILVSAGYSNAFLYNFFSLVELILITWQFYKWGLFHRRKRLALALTGIMTILWTWEIVMRKGVYEFSSYFIVACAIVIVLMSINMMNKVMFNEPAQLFYNPIFLICMGFIIYFTYAILVEVFWFYGLNKSREFRIRIYEILAYINLFTNLVYAFAILWIPLKRQYIMQS